MEFGELRLIACRFVGVCCHDRQPNIPLSESKFCEFPGQFPVSSPVLLESARWLRLDSSSEKCRQGERRREYEFENLVGRLGESMPIHA